MRSGEPGAFHSPGNAELGSNEVAAQEEAALVFACLVLVLSAFCTGHFILRPKAEQPAGWVGHGAGGRAEEVGTQVI